MAKSTFIQLFRPDGGTILQYDDVTVTHYTKDIVEFQSRKENEDGETVTVTDYTSNLPYLVIEAVTGPKSLL